MSCLLLPIMEGFESIGRGIKWLSGDREPSLTEDDGQQTPRDAEEEKDTLPASPAKGKPQSPIRPVRKHQAGSKREKLHQYTVKTLGSGDLWKAVALPDGESLEEWIAVHTEDFFNELSLLYGTVADEAATKFVQPGQGFPPGFVYMWPGPDEELLECSAPQYVDFVMSWAEDMLNDPTVFPSSTDSEEYPANFLDICKSLFKRLFRVFAIIYCQHFELIESHDMAPHLNTSFKHFLFFCLEFQLVEAKEYRPLEPLVSRIKQLYESGPPKS